MITKLKDLEEELQKELTKTKSHTYSYYINEWLNILKELEIEMSIITERLEKDGKL